MIISRAIVRKMILREVKNALNDPDVLLESGLIDRLTSDTDATAIVAKIKKVPGIDTIILLALSSEENKRNFASAITKLDKVKTQLILDVMGKLRGVLSPSTFEKLKNASGLKI